MGMAKQSPIKCVFTVSGMVNWLDFPAFFSAAMSVKGMVAALDMLVKPVMAAGSIFLMLETKFEN